MPTADDRPVAARVGEALRAAGWRLAIAESATGGLVSSQLTDVAGASDYFDRGYVTYANRAKQAVLGVPRESLDAHGAVSAPVAEAMAAGVRDVAGSDWGLATTGIAGPAGGSPEKPVGTAYVGVAYAAPWGSGESSVMASRHQFDGDRAAVKVQIAETALSSLLEYIERIGTG